VYVLASLSTEDPALGTDSGCEGRSEYCKFQTNLVKEKRDQATILRNIESMAIATDTRPSFRTYEYDRCLVLTSLETLSATKCDGLRSLLLRYVAVESMT